MVHQNGQACMIGVLEKPRGGSVRHYIPTDRLLRVSLIRICYDNYFDLKSLHFTANFGVISDSKVSKM